MADIDPKEFAREHAPALAAPIARLVEQVIAKGVQGHLHHAAELQLALNKSEAELERLRETMKTLGRLIHDQVVANQAAWIEWKHGRGAEAAMTWVHNGLVGPGHIPDESQPWAKEAQAWYSANCADPMPTCQCGRPSHIGWMGKGFCCNEHYEAAMAAADSKGGAA